MTLTPSRSARWLAPLAVAAVAVAVVGARASFADEAGYSSPPTVPAVSADQLLAKVKSSNVDRLSGVVQTTSRVGATGLPKAGKATTLLSGKRTLAIYLDGADRQRFDVRDARVQSRFVHNKQDVWQWSSATNRVIHTTLPAAGTVRTQQFTGVIGTPQALATQLLGAVDPNTVLSVGPMATVAGRSAQVLRVAPAAVDSLIARTDVYLDAVTGLPLRTAVFVAKQDQPVLMVTFVSIKFASPAAGVFKFVAPAGAQVTDVAAPAGLPGGLPGGLPTNIDGLLSGLPGGVPGGLLGALPGGLPGNIPGAVNPAKVAPLGALPAAGLPKAVDPKAVDPKNVVPKGVVPNGLLPNGLVPNGLVPNGLVPGGLVPGGLVPGGLVPGGVVPNNVVPKGVVPKGVVPQGVVPQGVVPKNLVPKGVVPAVPAPVSPLVLLDTGWSAVSQAGSLAYVGAGTVGADQQLKQLLTASPQVSGLFGKGRLVSTQLMSMLVTDDGKVYIGAVSPQALLRIVNSAA